MDLDANAEELEPQTTNYSEEISSSRKRANDENEEEMDDEVTGEMKKRRMPAGDDIGPKLVNLIKRLDQDLEGATIESALESLANVLHENLDPYEGQIIHILYECAAYLPEKITIFSTLVGILNARSYEFGMALLTRFVEELQNTFRAEEYDISTRILTFLCDLGNAHVVNLNSILDLFDDFLELAAEANTKSDFFVYSVMHTLPWIGPELNEKMDSRLNALLDRIAAYLGKRRKQHTKLLQVWSDPHFPQEDYLDSLWAQLQKLQSEGWLEKHILRTYVFFQAQLAESVEHELPSLDMNLLRQSQNHPLPRCVFRFFQQSDCLENEVSLPPGDSIERFLVEEDLNWLIDNNYTDWKVCARALLGYHRRETVPLNYVVIEAIFGQLFRLPAPPHLELFYGALLIELCRSQSSSMPQVLALAAEMLYQRADTMQPICLDRFVDWFSYHLSNFEYRWSWADWAECVELDSLHPRRIFVREVIDKCMRLSYHKKLFEFLPQEFGPIIPDEPNIVYILDDDRHPAYEKAEQFKEMIMQKRGDEEVLGALEVAREEAAKEGEEASEMGENGGGMELEKQYSPDSVAVFFAVLLKLASKTLTHSFAALTRYHKTLCTLTNGNEQMQSIILRTLYDSWSLHKQMMSTLVDKMVKMNILEPAIVQAWVFSEEMKVEFKRTWVWDVLSSAISHLERLHKRAEGEEQKRAEENLRVVLLNICHKFTLIITEHILNCETDGTEVETNFYNFVTGRFKYILLKHIESVWRVTADLENELFSSPTIDPRISLIFEQFKSLRNA